MQLSDQARFMEVLTGIAELHNKTLSPIQLEIYWNALITFELEDISRALTVHTVNPDGGQFMPKPADIHRILLGGGQSKAQLAWSKVVNAMGRHGGGKTVVFDDALIHAVIADMEGWIKLCTTDDKELPFRARDFEQRYAAYLLKPPLTYPKQLSGYIEQHNSAHGFDEFIPDAQLVGDRQKALEVHRDGIEPEKLQEGLDQLEASRACQALPSVADEDMKKISLTSTDTDAKPNVKAMSEVNTEAGEFLALKKVANGGG